MTNEARVSTETALKMAIEALEKYVGVVQHKLNAETWGDIEDGGKPARNAIQACKEALEQPAQEYLTRAQQVIRANNSTQEHCVNLKMDKCEHKNICEHCTHPAPSEPFIGGGVCPSCGNHSLFKTDKSEWCVTHKCLWQSDYPPSWQGLSDDNMSIIFDKFDWKEVEIAGEHLDLFAFARAIEQALKEKNYDT